MEVVDLDWPPDGVLFAKEPLGHPFGDHDPVGLTLNGGWVTVDQFEIEVLELVGVNQGDPLLEDLVVGERPDPH
ncbi:MAG: hypothetical protein CME19_23780 [Gemmatimonadetes bacterium]|nr:hypothetical protein [Gemmatimonadota bacterium]